MEENQNTQNEHTENQEEILNEPLTDQETIEEEQPTCEELLVAEKDKNLRIFAEFDNYRKRSQKEKAEFFKYANQDTLVSLLPVLDDFQRAIGQLENDGTESKTLEGVQLIYNKLFNTLQDKGLTPMDIKKGDDFDVETQEAITQIETDDPELKNKVVDVVEKGYLLGDKVIRYAKVVTGK